MYRARRKTNNTQDQSLCLLLRFKFILLFHLLAFSTLWQMEKLELVYLPHIDKIFRSLWTEFSSIECHCPYSAAYKDALFQYQLSKKFLFVPFENASWPYPRASKPFNISWCHLILELAYMFENWLTCHPYCLLYQTVGKPLGTEVYNTSSNTSITVYVHKVDFYSLSCLYFK